MDQSIVRHFTTHLRQALAKAMQFAAEFGHQETTLEHVLYGLAAEKGSISQELLSHANVPVDLLKQDLIRRFHTPYFHDAKAIPDFGEHVISMLTKAVRLAHNYGHTYVGTEHVLASMLEQNNTAIRDLLNLWQINVVELQRRLVVVLKSTSKFPDITQTIRFIPSPNEEQRDEPEFPSLQSLGKEMTTREYLDQCPPLVGREKEIERLQQVLGRRFKNNPLLVGKPGVGKTAVVEGLAAAILAGKVPPFLQRKRIFALELGSLVAGTMYRGDFEQRLRALVEEIKSDPNIIVFIDEIHTLVGAGASGQPLDAANMLKPALARGDIRCIGATTWDEYQKHLAQDSALTRRFQMVMVDEPTLEETREVLHGVRNSFEEYHRVQITDEAIEAALRLSERYLTHTCWPDKAIDLVDEAASRVLQHSALPPSEQKKQALQDAIEKLQHQVHEALEKDQYAQAASLRQQQQEKESELASLRKKPARRIKVTENHIRDIVSIRTGIPTERLHMAGAPIAQQLYDHLRQDIIGQDEALHALSQAIQRGYSPLKESQKPMGAFLFLGPSGVGKTATAKRIAKHLFGDEKSLVRLDMSEYSERFTTSKLIGAPAGYVGYQQSGTLTNAVRQKPLSVLLFDEVDKAHPDIFNLLLQLLDEGSLLDGSGQRVDFRHTLIILTSNLGLQEFKHRMGFLAGERASQAAQAQEWQGAAKEFFREEFMNRLDGIIHFQPLGIEARKAIIRQKIDRLQERLVSQVQFNASEEAIRHLAETAYQPEQGARSLERGIKEHIEYPLIELLPKRKPGTKIDITLADGRISLA